MRYPRQGPHPAVVTLIAAALVFGGYFLYLGVVEWIEQDFQADQRATETAVVVQTVEQIARATSAFMPFPTATRVPDCEIYYVTASSAFVRECPSLTCPSKERFGNGANVCVIGRADDNEYFDGAEWYKIDLNESASFLDEGYMHESVLTPRYPTPRPTATFTPLPTITPLPTVTASPTPSG